MRRDPDLLPLLVGAVLVNAAAAAAAWWVLRHHDPAHPEAAWSLLLIPILCAWVILRHRKRNAEVRLSTLSSLYGHGGWRARFRHVPLFASIGGLALLLLSLVQPQQKESWEDDIHEGIDIIIAMDVSASMLARDFEPDRLRAAKAVGLKFIDQRPNDRIGLVVYEGEAFTQCPLTSDHTVLKDLMMQVRSGLIQGGTAVGMGLATAVNRLRESDGKSKVVILLTDGVSNQGTVQPADAAQIAAQYGIRVYTIGVGTHGQALSPVQLYPNGQYQYAMAPVEIDEATLRQVAELTSGKYFRATDNKKLEGIYEEINQLETTRHKVTEHSRRKEEYYPIVLVGACCLAFGFILDKTLLRTTP